MKKMIKSALAIGCATILSFGLVGCQKVISAYDIAVKHGFEGTEEEWLLSLYGENGKDAPALTFEDLYETAKQNGYKGSLLDFCLDVGVDVHEDNNTATLAKNLTAVISLNCAFEKNVSSGWFGGVKSEYYGSSAGSGVIIDLNKEAGSAYIVTNYHVVYDSNCNTKNKIANDIYMYTYDARNYFDSSTGTDTFGDPVKVTFVGGAMDYDIALLKVEGSEFLKKSIATEATLGNSDEVNVGEKVYAIGNPEGAGIAVTSGAISVESEYITMTSTDNSRYVEYRVMRTDAAINGGNSGGALYNANGELIGIVNAKSVGEELDNMGYALPITQVKNICKNLWDNEGAVKRAMLGVMVSTEKTKVSFDKDGHLLTTETFVVAEEAKVNSSAYGKLKVGDVFRTIQVNDGEVVTLTRQYQLNDMLLTVRKGDTVKLGMYRSDNNVGDITVEIVFDRDTYFTTYA